MTDVKKSFWSRPEGKTGLGILAVIAVGVAYGVSLILPWLITLIANVYILGALLAGLWLIYTVLTSERFSTLLFYVFQMISRSITSLIVNIDPEAILDGFIKRMEQKHAEVVSSITRIAGHRRTLEDQMRMTQKEMDEAVALAEAAQAMGKDTAFALQVEKVGRREKNLQEFQAMHANIVEIHTTLGRIGDQVTFQIENSKDERKELVMKLKLAKETAAATKAANSVLGKSDELDVRNMAADDIRNRYNAALGEMDTLVELSKEAEQGMVLTRMVNQAEGTKKLEELRAKVAAAKAPKQLTAGPAQPLQVSTGGAVAVPSWKKRSN